MRIVGKKKIKESWKEGGVLIVANHASYFDPPVVGVSYGKKTAFLARKTLFKKGFFGWLYPKLNAIPVDQDGPDMSSLKRIIKELKNGNPVLIFPEGQRSVDGTILPGEAGVGLVIAKSKAPVLPMRIFGAFEAFPRGAKIPKFFTKITVSVGDMITFDEDQLKTKTRESYQNLSDCVMNAIAKIEKP
ncbi:MAG: lysophospholipid acyltransferase family protein [Verrucomicrobiota bacterium]|nr:lysophospholipid acyltransferase family protein [Verrucomicrobiota bacterium]MEC8658549.1 lysophospholipid acyltransferase family protein [Verrucomicrobiota bacterium]MEC8691849.1 lysophospholipid acyltransferase family protein [Verrucomicrobiota bacterium]